MFLSKDQHMLAHYQKASHRPTFAKEICIISPYTNPLITYFMPAAFSYSAYTTDTRVRFLLVRVVFDLPAVPIIFVDVIHIRSCLPYSLLLRVSLPSRKASRNFIPSARAHCSSRCSSSSHLNTLTFDTSCRHMHAASCSLSFWRGRTIAATVGPRWSRKEANMNYRGESSARVFECVHDDIFFLCSEQSTRKW